MSNPGQTQQQTSPGPARNPKREAKRALAREAAARRAAAKRRRLIRAWSGVGVAVLVLAGGITYLVMHGGGSTPSDTSASSSTSAAPSSAVSTPPALATKPTVANPKGTPAPTSLKVTTLVQGNGPAVQTGQHLVVNYVGLSFTDGNEFDSSWKGGAPFDFTIGQGGVIPGWDQGLIGVKVGSRVQLDIPSNLAYGDTGQVPGALRFVVDVLSAS